MNRATNIIITPDHSGHLKSEESRPSTKVSFWSAIPGRVHTHVQVPSDSTNPPAALRAESHVQRIVPCPKLVNPQVWIAAGGAL